MPDKKRPTEQFYSTPTGNGRPVDFPDTEYFYPLRDSVDEKNSLAPGRGVPVVRRQAECARGGTRESHLVSTRNYYSACCLEMVVLTRYD